MNSELILIYHAESESYFYGTLAVIAACTSEDLNNVTGYAEHEAEARKRGITRIDAVKRLESEAVTKHQTLVVNGNGWRCCANCLRWDGKQCGYFKAVPPPHIILHGCKDHETDIPF